MTDALRSAHRLLALSWHQDPGKTLASIVLVLANAIAVPLLALALKWFTDAAVAW